MLTQLDVLRIFLCVKLSEPQTFRQRLEDRFPALREKLMCVLCVQPKWIVLVRKCFEWTSMAGACLWADWCWQNFNWDLSKCHKFSEIFHLQCHQSGRRRLCETWLLTYSEWLSSLPLWLPKEEIEGNTFKYSMVSHLPFTCANLQPTIDFWLTGQSVTSC